MAAIIATIVSGNNGTRQGEEIQQAIERAAPKPPTRVRIYAAPTDPTEVPEPKTFFEATICYAPGRSSERADSAVCFNSFTGDDVDPCFYFFEDFMAPFVLYCPPTVDRVQTVIVNVPEIDREPPEDPTRIPSVTDGMPWRLRLANGRECIWVHGVYPTVGGNRLNYGCARIGNPSEVAEAGDAGVVIGLPDRSSSRWTVLFARSFGTDDYVPVEVLRADF